MAGGTALRDIPDGGQTPGTVLAVTRRFSPSWRLFVIAGSASHYCAILRYVL
jgi:predicted membrane channel-forming protein YqfA (hemolysin III family)